LQQPFFDFSPSDIPTEEIQGIWISQAQYLTSTPPGTAILKKTAIWKNQYLHCLSPLYRNSFPYASNRQPIFLGNFLNLMPLSTIPVRLNGN
jgi:hypothetical protein